MTNVKERALVDIGTVRELTRYPVKSMAGVAAERAFLGWHGLGGDRRYAFRRVNDKSGFPWLTASRLPEMLLYRPAGLDHGMEEPAPTHVRTPDGRDIEITDPALQEDVAKRFGSPLELMNLRHGIFDDASLSVITLPTIAAIADAAEQRVDTRRFRGNVVVDACGGEAFAEDRWIGARLIFGDAEGGPIVSVTMRDQRCMMINLDPDTAKQDPQMMKAAVRLNGNNAGAYCTVVRTGWLEVGQPVRLELVETLAGRLL